MEARVWIILIMLSIMFFMMLAIQMKLNRVKRDVIDLKESDYVLLPDNSSDKQELALETRTK